MQVIARLRSDADARMLYENFAGSEFTLSCLSSDDGLASRATTPDVRGIVLDSRIATYRTLIQRLTEFVSPSRVVVVSIVTNDVAGIESIEYARSLGFPIYAAPVQPKTDSILYIIRKVINIRTSEDSGAEG